MQHLRLFVVILIAMFFGMACSQQESHVNYQSELIRITKVNEHIFIHESFLETQTWGKVGCNGMVFIKNGEAIVFDAPTNDAASDELIAWIGEKTELKYLVVNHFHDDCVGGLKAFHEKGVPSIAHQMTLDLVKQDSSISEDYWPKHTFNSSHELTIGGETIINRYFGRAHTHDNIVSYIPSENALFGGCMVKSMGAGKGNLADADTTEWSNTIEKILKTYPEPDIVVPGHGPYGDFQLLHFTSRLFSNQLEN